MNKRQKLEIITEDIRSKLPRLMKIQKCCILSQLRNSRLIFFEVTHILKLRVYMQYMQDSQLHYISFLKSDPPIYYKIVGKEPMLNDVLEWMHLLVNDSYTQHITKEEGKIYIAFTTEHFLIKNAIELKSFDLSKPYLKDQSEEYIDFLLAWKNKLINNNTCG